MLSHNSEVEPLISTRPDYTLRVVVAALAYGVPAESAAQYAIFAGANSVVGMNAPGTGTVSSICAYLKTKDMYVVPASETGSAAAGCVHQGVVVCLSRAPSFGGHVPRPWIDLSRAYWPQETRDLEDGIVAQYVPD